MAQIFNMSFVYNENNKKIFDEIIDGIKQILVFMGEKYDDSYWLKIKDAFNILNNDCYLIYPFDGVKIELSRYNDTLEILVAT